MKGIEVVMVKWLLVVGVVLGIGESCARAETTSVEELERAYGNYEASCQNLTLVKSESEEVAFSGKVKVLPIDVERCGRILKPLQMNDVFRPLFVMASKVDETSFSKQRVLRKIQQLIEEQRRKSMIKSLHANAQPLADACIAVAAGREKYAGIMCYFGGPTAESSKAFKAIYQAELDGAIPESEAVCSAEPITWKNASIESFRDVLPDKSSSTTWGELKSGLKRDDFSCESDKCLRNIVGILLPTNKVLAEKSDANGKPPFVIIPRQLTIYRGDWMFNGQLGGCMVDRNGKQSGKCAPDNGVDKGICLVGEYGHIWNFVVAAMNVFKNE